MEAARLVVQVVMARLVVAKAAVTEEASAAVVRAMTTVEVTKEKKVAVPVVRATEEVLTAAAIQRRP